MLGCYTLRMPTIQTIPTIYKEDQFEAFLATIKGSAVAHWIDIARAVGVHQDTITAWKQHPRARAAIQNGIAHALAAMERAGKKDWRMWESKLKMLGVISKEKTDQTVELQEPKTIRLDIL